MSTFKEDLQKAITYHGHLCSGQCIGVKMARYALRLLKIDPLKDKKRLLVYVENDRCPADAISVVTDTRVGRRTLKVLPYGKTAATFYDLFTKKALRIYRHNRLHPEKGEDLVAFYENLKDEDIFTVQQVHLSIKPTDLPGPPLEVTTCHQCGENITDGKHLEKDGLPFCPVCLGIGYYTL